jgi:hypothetical protein
VGGRSTCADDYTAAYFIDLTLPPVGAACAEDAAPFSAPAPGAADAAPAAATPGPLAGPASPPVAAIPAPPRMVVAGSEPVRIG